MTPHHCIEYCRVCGAGLCGIRLCGLGTSEPHGLVVCDECEAIWTDCNCDSDHQYVDPQQSQCPTCAEDLWGPQSRWATEDDLVRLGWQQAVNPDL